MLGPRLGKFSRQGKSNAIPVQNVTLCVLGVFALWLGWFGFFGAAGLSDEKSIPALIAKTVLNLNLSVAASVTVAVILTSIRYKKPDVTIIFNAVTAGLVAVSAGCDTVGPTGAIIIGALAGVAVGFSIEMVDKAFKVDDPVGAVSTHGVCGLLGTVLVGFFTENGGMLYTGRWDAVGTQMLGAAAVALWSAALMSLVFLAVRATMGMRVSHRAEVEGIDAADFALYTPAGQVMSMSLDDYADYADEPIPVEAAVPVKSRLSGHTTGKLTMVQIIMKQARFEALKEALNDIGVTGMTVSHVLGCGMQKGETEYHRGVPLDIKLLPKIKIELVVAKIPVEDVIRTARRVLYTGHIGDGKIFVLDVQNAVKVRTGEDGYDALQGVDE
jgi:Amt family ammonium transporter